MPLRRHRTGGGHGTAVSTPQSPSYSPLDHSPTLSRLFPTLLTFVHRPRVPGHETIGDVAAVGPNESKWKVGDRVGAAWHGGHDGSFISHPLFTYDVMSGSDRAQEHASSARRGISKCATTGKSMVSLETAAVRLSSILPFLFPPLPRPLPTFNPPPHIFLIPTNPPSSIQTPNTSSSAPSPPSASPPPSPPQNTPPSSAPASQSSTPSATCTSPPPSGPRNPCSRSKASAA